LDEVVKDLLGQRRELEGSEYRSVTHFKAFQRVQVAESAPVKTHLGKGTSEMIIPGSTGKAITINYDR